MLRNGLLMSDVAISVECVGKKYCRSLQRTLVYGAQDVARDVLGLTPRAAKLRRDEFWALNDVSFEIRRGECVGLIGANGAGKSTILKLLNGVILPDKGSIHVRGRVGGLLELGAGFHPMLTGRENIHLSGAILGLSKSEIETKLKGIVEFAELQEFIDTPVKYYSSGMYVRLGFSVAISIDPEILIVDEALAVGDASFRRRCMERIDAFIKAGKTIVLVSHNFQEISRVTSRALLLDHGRLIGDGPTESVIADYLDLLSNRSRQEQQQNGKIAGPRNGPDIEIVGVDVCGPDDRSKYWFRTHDELRVRVRFIARQPFSRPVFRVQFYRSDGLFCYGTNTERYEIDLGRILGEGLIVLVFPDLGLLGGDYSIRVAVLSTQYDEIPIHQWVVSPGIHVESGMRDGGGVFAMRAEWRTIALSGE
jgi:ABC-type polysaccharide/polyol phosphate transport system ATPase subunit